MIGLAVVVFVTVFAAGISASVSNAIDRNFQGDLVLQNSDGFSPISNGAGRAAGNVEGVQTVSSLSFAGGVRDGKDVRALGCRPGGRRPTFSHSTGRTARPRRCRPWATAKRWPMTPGRSPTTSTWATRSRSGPRWSSRARFTIEGTVKDNADLLGNLVVAGAGAAP